MNLYLTLIFCGLLVVGQIACGDSGSLAERDTSSNSSSVEKDRAITPANGSPSRSDSGLFLGCWSSGNGYVMRIGEDQIRLSTNSFKPVSYSKYKMDGNRLVLELPGRPQFYFLREVVSLEIDNAAKTEFSLILKDYTSVDNYERNEVSGFSSWMRFSCSEGFKGGSDVPSENVKE